jgi:hypothetical protein
MVAASGSTRSTACSDGPTIGTAVIWTPASMPASDRYRLNLT